MTGRPSDWIFHSSSHLLLQEAGQDDGNCSDCTIYEDIDELVQQFDLTMKATMDQVNQMNPTKKTKKSKGKKDKEGNIVGKVGVWYGTQRKREREGGGEECSERRIAETEEKDGEKNFNVK